MTFRIIFFTEHNALLYYELQSFSLRSTLTAKEINASHFDPNKLIIE